MTNISKHWQSIMERKKLWLTPVLALIVIIGGLLLLTEGSIIAPYIYTIF